MWAKTVILVNWISYVAHPRLTAVIDNIGLRMNTVQSNVFWIPQPSWRSRSTANAIKMWITVPDNFFEWVWLRYDRQWIKAAERNPKTVDYMLYSFNRMYYGQTERTEYWKRRSHRLLFVICFYRQALNSTVNFLWQ